MFDLTEDITLHSEYMWTNYICGVIKLFYQPGPDFHGVNLVVSGNVPQGTGLSSSVALEVTEAQKGIVFAVF